MLPAYTSAVSAKARSGDVKGARRLMDKLLWGGMKPDEIAHTALLDAFARQGDVEAALSHIKYMKMEPTFAHHNAVLRAFSRKCDTANCQVYMEEWLEKYKDKEAPRPDIASFTIVLACCSQGPNINNFNMFNIAYKIKDNTRMNTNIYMFCKFVR